MRVTAICDTSISALALDLAHQLGVPMKHAEVTYKDYAAALERGWGDLDSRSHL